MLSRRGETSPLFITTPLAPVGLLWPKVFVGTKNPDRWPEEAPTKHDQAPEVTVETRLVLAHTVTPIFGPTVETRLFRQDTGDFFGTGIMVVDLRHMGTTAWLNKMLKISVRTSISCTAQSLSTWPGMFSGPTTLHGLILDRVFLMSAEERPSV